MGAYGAAGNTGTWDDLLIEAPLGAWALVNPTRGESYIMLFEAEAVHCISREEAETVGIDLSTELQTL